MQSLKQFQISIFPKTIYLMSGGKSSTLTAYYHRRKHPDRDYLFYFNDTLIEHSETYRFLVESLYFLENIPVSKRVAKMVKSIPELRPGVDIMTRTRHLDKMFELVCDATGLHRERSVDPWDRFAARRFIGNNRVDVCSEDLKRKPRKVFTDAQINVEICLGLNWTEVHRYEKALTYEPNIIAPLATDFVDINELWNEFHGASGIQVSNSYGLGLAHDNCSGGCVKSGQAQWAIVFKHRRDFYLWSEERMEQIMGENPALRPFLRKTSNGRHEYLTLKQFRQRFLEPKSEIDQEDFGGCGCAL